MQKTKIIKEIIGKKIEPYGFHYLKTDGSMRIFVREVKGIKRYYDPEVDVVKQYIEVQESRFAKEVIVRFHTDAHGNKGMTEIDPLRRYGGGWTEYTDEDSYKKVLMLFADLIIKYALDMLDEMSVEEEAIPTKKMYERLLHHSDQLDQNLTERYHIKTEPEKIEDIDEWEQLIRKLITESLSHPYEEAKELLMEIAAFIGNRYCELCDAEWYSFEYLVFPRIRGGNPYRAFSPLDVVVDIWRAKCEKESWEFFNTMIAEFKKGFLVQSR